jgi:hypothetical protein
MSAAHFTWSLTLSTLSPMILALPLVEFRLELRHVAELGGAHRGEVLGMREQHGPRVADPVVEPDLASVVSASKSGATLPICRVALPV